jgi:hypothetical protein
MTERRTDATLDSARRPRRRRADRRRLGVVRQLLTNRTVRSFLVAWAALWILVAVWAELSGEHVRNLIHNFAVNEYPHPFAHDTSYLLMLANHTALLVLGFFLGLAWARSR